MVTAAKEAYTGRVAADLRWGSDTLAGVGFNRRFVMADGTVETHPLKMNPLIVGREGPDSKVRHWPLEAAFKRVCTRLSSS